MKLNRPSEDSTTKDKAHSAQGDVNDRTTDVEGKSETSDRVSTRTSAIKKTGERGMDPSHVTKEELRLKRYESMLRRSGFDPEEHLPHLERMMKNQGADATKLGPVSQRLYMEIFNRRAFDEFYALVPAKKSPLEAMSKVAKKFIAKGPGGEHGREQEHVDGGDKKEKAQRDGDRDGITFKQRELEEEARRKRIGYKPEVFGPPGLAPPMKNIFKSEGKEKYFSYEGDWVDGHMHGYGSYQFADGSSYEGVMRQDWPSEQGTARYSNGAVYEGGWKDGKCEGYGKLTLPTGTVYEGAWKEGYRCGRGKLVYKSGSNYTGEFLLGNFHGRGRYESANLNTMLDFDNVSFSRPLSIESTLSRFGGGLSIRGAVELVRAEEAQVRADRENDRKTLFGVVDTVELDLRVAEVRQTIAEKRLAEKIARRQEDAAKKRAARLALLEARMKALLREEEEDDSPPDKIGKLVL